MARTANALAVAGIGSVATLAGYSDQQLLRIANFGMVSLADVRRVLNRPPPLRRRFSDVSDQVLIEELVHRGYTVQKLA